MSKKEETPKMKVPDTLEMVALDLKRAYETGRRDSRGGVLASRTCGAVEALLYAVAAPFLRCYDRGPGGFEQDMFINTQIDIRYALEGKAPLMGDRWLGNYPEEYATHLVRAVREGDTEALSDTNVGKVAQYILYNLQKKEEPGEGANLYFASWLDAVLHDHDRMKRREASRNVYLQEIYNGKGRENDVRLVLAGADLRTGDLSGCFREDISQAMAIASLYKNWERGKIYVPREVLEEAGVGPAQSVDDVKRSRVIRIWRRDTGLDTVKRLKENVYELEHGVGDRHRIDRRAKRCLARRVINVIEGDYY